MRSIGMQTGENSSEDSQMAQTGEADTTFNQVPGSAPAEQWAINLIEEGVKSDPRDFSTPNHWLAISKKIAAFSKMFPPFSTGLPYPTETSAFPPADYISPADDQRQTA